MKVYIAGPMTGIEDFNRPAFDARAELLRAMGHAVVNPHEITDLVFNGNTALPREDYMKADLHALLQCDAITLLPGWGNSVGALCEIHVARAIGLKFIGFGEDGQNDHS